MLDAMIRLSLRYRTLVIVLALAVMVYGSYLATTLPIDVFPDLDRPRVVILTECPGLSPEEVETLVTQPIESRLLGATGVQAVRSQSSSGLTVIYVEFGWATDIRAARQVVQERLATLAGVLPDGIRPQMTPPTSIMGQIMHVGLHRRKGPQGGDLFPVGRTGLLAERLEKSGGPHLTVWRPDDRHTPENWQRVTVERVIWDAPPVTGGGKERRVQVFVNGQAHEVTLRTPLQQQMDLRTTADWEAAVGFYSQVIFPYLCDFLLNNAFAARRRRELLVHASGNVLEIGFGTGLNLPHYPERVRKLTTVDPNVGMHRLAQRRVRRSGIEVDQRVLNGEHLPFEEDTFDCVVSTFTLCSIEDVSQALSEVYRVLKPGGRFLFLEHGLSPEPGVQKWQRRLNWLEMRLADGCHLDRNMKALVAAQPFASVEVEEFYLEKTPRTHGYLYRGIAAK